MSIEHPSPRKAVVAFGVAMNNTILGALGAVTVDAGNQGPWDAEDAIYAFRDHAQPDRAAWASLETAMATRLDPAAAITLAEGIAGGVSQGQPPNPSTGTEAEVLSCWGAHALTAPEDRARVRALSRLVANRVNPSAVLAALAAAVGTLDPA